MASENVRSEVESVRMASIFAARARKGALAIALLVACISNYFEGLFCSMGRKALSDWGVDVRLI